MKYSWLHLKGCVSIGRHNLQLNSNKEITSVISQPIMPMHTHGTILACLVIILFWHLSDHLGVLRDSKIQITRWKISFIQNNETKNGEVLVLRGEVLALRVVGESTSFEKLFLSDIHTVAAASKTPDYTPNETELSNACGGRSKTIQTAALTFPWLATFSMAAFTFASSAR